jgi:hypothetical protein
VTTEEANAFGGCGSSGFYSLDGEEVYFQSTVCEFSTTTVPILETSESVSVTTQRQDTTSESLADSTTKEETTSSGETTSPGVTTPTSSSSQETSSTIQTPTYNVPDNTVSNQEENDNNPHSSADRLSDGAIAGIIVGTAVGLIGISLLATYYLNGNTTPEAKYIRL